MPENDIIQRCFEYRIYFKKESKLQITSNLIGWAVMERVMSQILEGEDVFDFRNFEFEVPMRHWHTDNWETDESRIS